MQSSTRSSVSIDRPVAAYRSSLRRLREASKALAECVESSEGRGRELATDSRFVEIWSNYNNILTECRQAFELIPPRQQSQVPKPPRA